MIEFSFRVKLIYRDAQAFNDEDLARVHDRLNEQLFEALTDEFKARSGRIVVESEPT